MEGSGLKGVTKQILLETMVRHACGSTRNENKLCALVVDEEGQRVLGASCNMSDLTAEGVTHVEDLREERQPQDTLGAIYFIAPTEGSIGRLLWDFDEGRKFASKTTKAMYREAWVFFTGHIPDPLFERLSRAQKENRTFRRAMACCRELLVEFMPLPTPGGRSFSLNVPELSYDMYRERSPEELSGRVRELQQDFEAERMSEGDLIVAMRTAASATPSARRTVDRLFQLCISLGETPETVYFRLDEGARGEGQHNPVLQTRGDVQYIAEELHRKLTEFTKDSPQQEQYMKEMGEKKNDCFRVLDEPEKTKPKAAHRNDKALLVLLDRSVDPVGPLIHDLSYEGMCHDIFDVNERGDIEYTDTTRQEEKMLATGDARDEVWRQFRDMHLSNLGTELQQAYEDFSGEYRFMGGSKRTGREEEKRIAHLRDFTLKKTQFAGHIAVAQQLLAHFQEESSSLTDLCRLESNLVMGRDQFEDKLNAQDLRRQCLDLLPQLEHDADKIRLVAVYWLCTGENASDALELVRAAFPSGSPREYAAVVEQLTMCNFSTNLDRLAHKRGTGTKHYTSYGYGTHPETAGRRRRYTTEPAGQERNPQRKEAGEIRVQFQDEVSRYRPTLYWLLKDLAQGRRNPNKEHWAGVLGDDGGIKNPIDWKDQDDEREITNPRTIIICVLGGVTYAEIQQAAEIERRTGCTVLIGGSEVLTPEAYLQRLSMQGEWIAPPVDHFDPQNPQAVSGPTAAAGRQVANPSSGCVDNCLWTSFPCVFAEERAERSRFRAQEEQRRQQQQATARP